jgi:hypothetical protein
MIVPDITHILVSFLRRCRSGDRSQVRIRGWAEEVVEVEPRRQMCFGGERLVCDLIQSGYQRQSVFDPH